MYVINFDENDEKQFIFIPLMALFLFLDIHNITNGM